MYFYQKLRTDNSWHPPMFNKSQWYKALAGLSYIVQCLSVQLDGWKTAPLIYSFDVSLNLITLCTSTGIYKLTCFSPREMCLHKQTSLHLYHLTSQPFSSGVTPWITRSFAKGIVAFSFLVYYHLYKSPRKTALLIQHYVLESIKKRKKKKKGLCKRCWSGIFLLTWSWNIDPPKAQTAAKTK